MGEGWGGGGGGGGGGSYFFAKPPLIGSCRFVRILAVCNCGISVTDVLYISAGRNASMNFVMFLFIYTVGTNQVALHLC